MSVNYDTCTMDEIRDELARLTGWKLETSPSGMMHWNHRGQDGMIDRAGGDAYHPITMSIDAIAALMPDGWRWRIAEKWTQPLFEWIWCVSAHRMNMSSGGIQAQGKNELEARSRCLAKVLSAARPESQAGEVG